MLSVLDTVQRASYID